MSRFALALLLAAGMEAFAQSPPADPPEKRWPQSITLNLFASGSYDYNFDRPAQRRNAFRTFDFAGGWNFDVAEAVVQKAAEGKGAWGFRVDLEAGQSIPEVEAACGLFRNCDTGNSRGYDLQQAFATYIVPLGKGLQIDLGKYVTHLGYEVVEGYDGWNDNATHSFLFGYAIPFTQTGLRVSYPFSDRFSAQFHLVNGWDVFRDSNAAKTVGLQLAWNPTHKVSLTLNGIRGPEQKGDDRDIRQVYELNAIWKVSKVVSLGLNGDYGHDPGGVEPPGELPEAGTWKGVAAYQHTQITHRFAVNLREEWFADRQGARTGVPQTLHEVTFTPEFRLQKHVILRGDARYDWSDAAAFPARAGNSRHQATVLLNLLLVD